MHYQPALAYPALRLGTKEKLLALLIIASLLLQSLAGMMPPVVVRPALEQTTVAPEPFIPVAPQIPQSTLGAPPYALPPELAGKPEVPALRTLESATFDLGDGRFALFQDAMPLHYQDLAGNWQRLNPAFQQAGGKWINATNTVRTALDQRTSAATLSMAGVNLRWQPQALEVVHTTGESRTLSTVRDDAGAGIVTQAGRAVRYLASWQPAAGCADCAVGVGKRYAVGEKA